MIPIPLFSEGFGPSVALPLALQVKKPRTVSFFIPFSSPHNPDFPHARSLNLIPFWAMTLMPVPLSTEGLRSIHCLPLIALPAKKLETVSFFAISFSFPHHLDFSDGCFFKLNCYLAVA